VLVVRVSSLLHVPLQQPKHDGVEAIVRRAPNVQPPVLIVELERGWRQARQLGENGCRAVHRGKMLICIVVGIG
jgi:hypothetical protein